MKFTPEELELAQTLKKQGLSWTPQCGHYVLDQTELIECASPFQEHVYFILDLKHFLRRSGTMEELTRRVCWLPDWHDARDLLRQFGISSQDVAQHLLATNAIESGTERLELYRMIERHLSGEPV
jgi:hypothetical protein